MGRRKKIGFTKPKMLSSRVEEADFLKFEDIVNNRDGKSLQDFLNIFVTQYISGNLYLSGSTFKI
jgi:hypothetical protein